MTTNQTPTPDETVTRLAEAIYPDHRGGTMAREVANMVIRVIQSDPSLAGFPAHVASEWDYGIPVTSPIILLPDPDPPAPELPSVSDHIDATYKWVAARDDLEANPSPDAHRREKDAYIAMYQSVKRIHAAARPGGRSDR